ncbi:MAG TPA: hypothetical protein DET40_21130 [Lentisphaeria bacterium]|nr:MAG: hypothetical protein A2X45_03040 [Lentisphaerae bacterium GWF2_50_93]HCE46055.1 hypothetical protein [Lentisphaeria bacterium]
MKKNLTASIVLICLLGCLALPAADKEVENVLQERDTAIGKVNDDAVKKLDRILVARTKKGDLDGAMAVKNLIQKIKGGEAPTAAENAEIKVPEGVGGAPVNPANKDKMSDSAVKREIETRYAAFSKALVSEDMDSAFEILDPRTREAVAPQVLKGYLKVMAGFMKIAQIPKEGARVTSVKLGVKESEAKVVPALKIRGLNWEDQKPQYWVLRNGKWYIGDEKELDNFK